MAIIEEWSNKNNKSVDMIFVENPVSGAAKLKDRPQLSLLMQQLQKGDTLLAADMTRLSRNTMVFNMILGMVNNAEAHIEFCDGHKCDSDDLVAMLMTSILSWTSMWEREQIATRTKQSLKLVKQTKALGRPDRCEFGYRNVDGVKVPNTHEQNIGNMILLGRQNGHTLKQIQKELTDNGYHTRTGKEYSLSGISQLSRTFATHAK
jgi:DNA invertase Pin-like site-specific DNA recombinase